MTVEEVKKANNIINRIRVYENRIENNKQMQKDLIDQLEKVPDCFTKVFIDDVNVHNNVIKINANYFCDFLIAENVRNSEIIQKLEKELEEL